MSMSLSSRPEHRDYGYFLHFKLYPINRYITIIFKLPMLFPACGIKTLSGNMSWGDYERVSEYYCCCVWLVKVEVRWVCQWRRGGRKEEILRGWEIVVEKESYRKKGKFLRKGKGEDYRRERDVAGWRGRGSSSREKKRSCGTKVRAFFCGDEE